MQISPTSYQPPAAPQPRVDRNPPPPPPQPAQPPAAMDHDGDKDGGHVDMMA